MGDASPASTPADDAGSFPVAGFPSACPGGADSVALTPACETRRMRTCPGLDLAAEAALEAVLSRLLRECGETLNQPGSRLRQAAPNASRSARTLRT